MDEESKEILRQIVEAQKEQTELFRKHVLPLWTRIRFSLLALLLVMTMMALGLGFVAMRIQPASVVTPTTVNAVPTQWPPTVTVETWGMADQSADRPAINLNPTN
jgi:hypothetical protein